MSDNADDITCPYCGHAHSDSHEYAGNARDGDQREIKCESCSKRFMYHVNISVTYTSSKADCLNGLADHVWDKVYAGAIFPNARHCRNCPARELGERVNVAVKVRR